MPSPEYDDAIQEQSPPRRRERKEGELVTAATRLREVMRGSRPSHLDPAAPEDVFVEEMLDPVGGSPTRAAAQPVGVGQGFSSYAHRSLGDVFGDEDSGGPARDDCFVPVGGAGGPGFFRPAALATSHRPVIANAAPVIVNVAPVVANVAAVIANVAPVIASMRPRYCER